MAAGACPGREVGLALEMDGPRPSGCLEANWRNAVSRTILFPDMRNGPVGETEVLREALRRVVELLPASWRLDERREVAFRERLGAVVELAGPNGDRASFAVETKLSGSVPTQVLLSTLRERGRRAGLPMLFASDYVGPSLRVALAGENISFADATGWVRVVSEEPLVLLTGRGADRSPNARSDSAVTRLNGIAASRVIRVLSATDLPLGVRELANLANVSPGSVSKLLATLASEGIADRDERGGILAVRRRALVRRWAQDYSFARSNRAVGYYIAPRGLDRAVAQIANHGGIALTGSAAARRVLPDGVTSVVPLRLLAMYADEPAALSRELGLIDAEQATANVVVAAPQDADILPRPGDRSPATAPAALVLADLLTLPGRSDAEADQLMDALAKNDIAWKA